MLLKRMMTVAVLAAFMAVVAPALASAQSLWVAKTPTGNGKSCTQPGYKSIQEAVTAASSGAKIHVCAGTYEEQLEVTKSVSLQAVGSVTVQLPASPAKSNGTCSAAESAETEDVVEICGAITVKVTGIDVRGAWPAGTCNNQLYDYLVGGGANLKLTSGSVLDAGAVPINGCQGGIGIRLGVTGSAGTATLKHVEVTGYQKEGILVNGAGSQASITDATVTGAGSTPSIAQNGIQVSRGAVAKISKARVTKNQYEPEPLSAGILFYQAGAGSSVKNSTVSEDDYGVYEESPEGKLSVTGSTFENDPYGVLVLAGNVKVNKSTFNNGVNGIELFSYEGETGSPSGTGSGDTIENMSEYAVAGFTENGPAGSFTISSSKISGNPGPTPEESVHSELPVIITTTPSDS